MSWAASVIGVGVTVSNWDLTIRAHRKRAQVALLDGRRRQYGNILNARRLFRCEWSSRSRMWQGGRDGCLKLYTRRNNQPMVVVLSVLRVLHYCTIWYVTCHNSKTTRHVSHPRLTWNNLKWYSICFQSTRLFLTRKRIRTPGNVMYLHRTGATIGKIQKKLTIWLTIGVYSTIGHFWNL